METLIKLITIANQDRQQVFSTSDTVVVQLAEPSVVLLQEPISDAMRFERMDNDLLVYNDSRTIQLSQFFAQDSVGNLGELVAGEAGQGASRVTFNNLSEAPAPGEAVELVAQVAPISLDGTVIVRDTTVDLETSEPPVPSDSGDDTANEPTVTIMTPVSDDDVISAAEYGQSLSITGTSTGLAKGDIVTVVIDGNEYLAGVQADGSWSVVLLPEVTQQLSAGIVDITATAETASGDIVEDSHSIFVIIGSVQVTIDPIGSDGQLNTTEITSPLMVTGSATNAPNGGTVVLELLDREYIGQIDENGNWSVELPTSLWDRLADGEIHVTATVTNVEGNTGQAETDIELDTVIPTVTINEVAEDNVVNAVEHGLALEVTGSTTGLEGGEVITVELNGESYTTVVNSAGNWSVVVRASDVEALADGDNTLNASVTTAAGNTGSGSHTFNVNTFTPTLTIDTPVAGDDIINRLELGYPLEISGTTTGQNEGDVVTIEFNGRIFTTNVEADGSWYTGIYSSDIGDLSDGLHVISASVENAVGNRAEESHAVIVDSTVKVIDVDIDTIAGDDSINATEAAADMTITGMAKGADAGDFVIVDIGGNKYYATVAEDGRWSTNVPASTWDSIADGSVEVTASITTDNSAGSETREVILDTVAPTLTINAIAEDDIVNAIEHELALEIGGTAGGLVGGEVVSVVLNGKVYTTAVTEEGTWELNVGAKDVMALSDGDYTVTASVSDAAGNEANAEHDFTVVAGGDNLLTLTITTPVAGDDVISSDERGEDLSISGVSTGLTEGSEVVVNLDGEAYTTAVAADGSWSLVVPADVVLAMANGVAVIEASAEDSIGNRAEDIHYVVVQPIVKIISIDPIAEDNIVNADEATQDTTITGTVTHATEGDAVTVSIGDTEYAGVIAADGSWSVDVPADAWAGIAEGTVPVVVSLDDGTELNQDVLLDTVAPEVTIDAIAADDIINAAEHGDGLTVTGSATGLAGGEQVNVNINGKDYTATAAADGSWKLDVPVEDVAALADGDYTVTATVVDTAGNEGSAQRDFSVVASADSLPTVSIDTIAGDDIVNAAEHAQALTVTGTTTNLAEGDEVRVELNGQTYSATVATDGSWSLDVPVENVAALADGDYTVIATVTDAAGNEGTAQRDFNVAASADSLPTVAIDSIAGDDIVNAAEHEQALTISGATTNLAEGDEVRVELNGQTYSATVAADGSWSVDVAVADVAALADGDYTVIATVIDAAGNEGTAQRDFSVAASANSLPTVAIDTIAGDDIINAAEHEQALTISGTTTNLVAGDKVNVELNGNAYEATVATDGSWSVDVASADVAALADGDYTVIATVTDAAGNEGSAQRDFNVAASADSLPTVAIDSIAGDDIVNAAEHEQALSVSGTTTNQAEGDEVRVELNGQTYSATVAADGSWSVDVAAADVAALADGDYTVTATVTDAAGNEGSAQRDFSVAASANSLPTVAIDTIAGDDIINAAEHEQALTISGTTTNLVAGDKVNVELNGNAYEATVATDGSWSVDVAAADVAALADGDYTVNATATDAAGNMANASHQVSVATADVPVTIDPVTGDDVINAEDAASDVPITGEAPAGSDVVVTVDGKEYPAEVEEDGTWTAVVPKEVWDGLEDGTATIDVEVTDPAGNTGNDSRDVALDTTPPVLSVDTIAGDDIINASEHDQPLTVSGSAEGVPAGGKVNVELNGNAYEATVADDGTWSVDVAAADVAALADGDYIVIATATDAAGNTGTDQRDFSVAASTDSLPGVSIATIAGDDIVNATEHDQALTISGTTTNQVAGDKVNVELNGNAYEATVAADGTWSVDVAAADVAALADGDYTVMATVTDAAGNEGTDQRDFSVVASADNLPTLEITGPLAGDDIINATEQEQALTVSGTSTKLEAGDRVNVELNGNAYEATVAADGTWSVDVAAVDVAALADGDYTVTAKATDAAGNMAEADHQVTVDVTAPVRVATITGITEDTGIAGDYITSDSRPVISGGTGGAAPYPDIRVEVSLDGGKTWQTASTPEPDGYWEFAVEQDLADGQYEVMARLTDAAGNSSAPDTVTMTVDTVTPTVTIDALAGDDVINATEHGQGLEVTGTTTDLAEGDKVSIELNGKSYEADVAGDGSWSLDVPAEDVAALADGDYTVTASVSDVAGNDSSAQRDFSVVASTDSLPGVSIGTIAGDDIVNASEHDQALTVSGMTTNFPEGGKVDIDFNGKAYEATVAADGSWSVDVAAADVAALEDGSYTVVATVTDAAGNEGRDERDFSVTASADSLPTLAIDTIAGDDIVDAAEHGQALTVSGTSTNLPQGDRVNVELNGKAYTATVAADGSWSVDVASADVAALADGDYTVKATATDAAGNEATAQHDFSVAASVPTVTIVGPIAGDDIISTVEHDQALAVDGTATGVAPGTIVRVEIVGVPNSTYLGLVKEDGSFRIGIAGEYVSMLQDGKAQVRAWATNDLGNTGEGFYEFDVVTGSLPVTIDMVTGDDVVDSTEAASAVTVTGSVINAAAGDEVVMKVGGDTYTGVVNEDGTTWSVDIDPVTWSHFKDTDIDVNVTVTNAQGNSGSAVRTVGLDISTPVIYFDTIAEDDIVNASEHAKDLAIGGSVLGLDGGETMYVELNGKTYTTTATADGRWTLNVPAADVSALADGNHTISASVTEEAGNTGTASHDFSVDTVLPTLTVTEGVTRSGDNIVTPDEHGTNLEVFGTSTGLDHDFVYLEIAGFTYNIQTFDDGTWGIVTRRADMATLTDGTYEIKLHATNDVGNVAETSVELVVDAGVPSLQLLSTEAQDSAVVDDQAVAGSVEDDTLESTQADEHFTIGNGGHDSVVYHLLDAADATGGNGADRISGFTVGDGNNTADADRIDLSELLAERRSTEGSDGAETTEAGDLSDYLSVTVKGSDTEIAIDRDGAGSTHEMTTVVTLSGVQTDLATLLANHQLVVS